mmetsp:Transcript_32012/g.75044  ORF Transcript_32012/g.75044 Transcript_32012/m.75044 type:complete len:294 (-) Transcript_32012:74-955(-)
MATSGGAGGTKQDEPRRVADAQGAKSPPRGSPAPKSSPAKSPAASRGGHGVIQSPRTMAGARPGTAPQVRSPLPVRASARSPGAANHGSHSNGTPSQGSHSGYARSPSPQRVAMSELDQRSIVTLSQLCTEDLDVKTREKNALTKLLADLKKKKLQYEAKIMKKRKEVDTTVVKTRELEQKLQAATNNNRVLNSELSGLLLENQRLQAEVEDVRQSYKEVAASFDRECEDVEKLTQTLYNYRKEINAEAKHRDSVQQELRVSKTAQTLMINRLDDMEKRSRALKTCVADTFNI